MLSKEGEKVALEVIGRFQKDYPGQQVSTLLPIEEQVVMAFSHTQNTPVMHA